MDAVEYLKEKSRLTRCGQACCDTCKLDGSNNGFDLDCGDLEECHPEKAVEIIEQWSNECPVETYFNKVFTVFPSAKEGMLDGNICVLDMFDIEVDCESFASCCECWKQSYKEPKI